MKLVTIAGFYITITENFADFRNLRAEMRERFKKETLKRLWEIIHLLNLTNSVYCTSQLY